MKLREDGREERVGKKKRGRNRLAEGKGKEKVVVREANEKKWEDGREERVGKKKGGRNRLAEGKGKEKIVVRRGMMKMGRQKRRKGWDKERRKKSSWRRERKRRVC